jgi:tellurite resistance protein TerC
LVLVNIFAILAYVQCVFLLANMLEKFSYLEYSLIAILTFRIKMLAHDYIELPEWGSVGFIALSFVKQIAYSLHRDKAEKIKKEVTLQQPLLLIN